MGQGDADWPQEEGQCLQVEHGSSKKEEWLRAVKTDDNSGKKH